MRLSRLPLLCNEASRHQDKGDVNLNQVIVDGALFIIARTDVTEQH